MTRHLCTAVLPLLVAAVFSGCSRETPTFIAGASAAERPGGARTQAGDATDISEVGKLAADYTRQCAREKAASRTCDVLRSLLVAQVSTSLQLIERGRDQRGVEQAMAALDMPDEPEIFIAGCRVLGQFPETEGIIRKVLPQLLENRSIAVQRAAAMLLASNPDSRAADIGRLWLRNHAELTTSSAYDAYPDFPAHYAAMAFPSYPGAAWFSPSDTDRSIGWSTKDDLETVARWFAQAAGAEALDFRQWEQVLANQAMQAFDASKTARMQQLMERGFNGDQSVMAEYEQLAKEMSAAADANRDAAGKAVDKVAIPPDATVTEARWIVMQRRGGRVIRLAMVYPVPGMRRTAIQLTWDLGDYAAAWPQPRD